MTDFFVFFHNFPKQGKSLGAVSISKFLEQWTKGIDKVLASGKIFRKTVKTSCKNFAMHFQGDFEELLEELKRFSAHRPQVPSRRRAARRECG